VTNRLGMSCLGSVIALALGACSGSGSSSSDVTPPDRSNEIATIDKAAALVREAQRYEVQEKDAIALEKYTQAIETYNELPVAWNNMGALLMKKGDNLKAAEAFMTASELSPTDPRPLHNLGSLWEKTGELNEAAKWYDRALERDDAYLPSLRRRILIDQLRDSVDNKSIARTRKALMLEKDPWWIDRFKRAELRFKESESALGASGADSMSK
jgi:tetratricopeptide (TPR) repeat protein